MAESTVAVGRHGSQSRRQSRLRSQQLPWPFAVSISRPIKRHSKIDWPMVLQLWPVENNTAIRLCQRRSRTVRSTEAGQATIPSAFRVACLHMARIDLSNLSDDPWERRALLVLNGIEERAKVAARFLREVYAQKELLETCRIFVSYDLPDAPRADVGSLRRLGFFPWVEIERELSEALNLLLLSSYKAVYDCYRRALELTVVAIYFTQEHVPEGEGRQWYRADTPTPFFARIVPRLFANSRFGKMDSECAWGDEIKTFYWKLCDVVHVRGHDASYDAIQPSSFHFNDVSCPEYSEESLSLVVDAFIETVRHIATAVAIDNPVLIFGLDLDARFGLNPPISGFFQDVQAERLRELLLPSVRTKLLELGESDDEVVGIREWMASMPHVTEEQITGQIQAQKELALPRRTRGPANK